MQQPLLKRVQRDRGWFEENLPKLRQVWDNVLRYRENFEDYCKEVRRPRASRERGQSVGGRCGKSGLHRAVVRALIASPAPCAVLQRALCRRWRRPAAQPHDRPAAADAAALGRDGPPHREAVLQGQRVAQGEQPHLRPQQVVAAASARRARCACDVLGCSACPCACV